MLLAEVGISVLIICKFSNKWTCTRKKEVEGLSCGFEEDANYIMRENIFEKIAREGRKYSLYLIISSQRPSELSQTVLSQCGNYIVHRIQNEVDMKYIYSVLPYFSEDYITKIKQAIPGEALIFGNCVPIPLLVKVTRANPAPNSDNCIINKEWFKKED